jgi:hypothetical protein
MKTIDQTITDLRRLITDLTGKVDEYGQSAEYWETCAIRRMNIITKQDAEIAGLKGKIDGLDLIIRGLNLDIAGMVKEIDRLRVEVDAGHDECLDREEIAAEDRARIYALEEENESLHDDIRWLNNVIKLLGKDKE